MDVTVCLSTSILIIVVSIRAKQYNLCKAQEVTFDIIRVFEVLLVVGLPYQVIPVLAYKNFAICNFPTEVNNYFKEVFGH